ncbi:MAG: hypothetical protein AAFR42_08815 [Cyanobacteria bacterium J06628_6]
MAVVREDYGDKVLVELNREERDIVCAALKLAADICDKEAREAEMRGEDIYASKIAKEGRRIVVLGSTIAGY